jgi:response regulator RpfG family c-di-GMP phosphodiesterase
MEAHTTLGAETLSEVARRHPFSGGFLQIAAEIARHHHERWDGRGYPCRLSGVAIPLAARIVAIADVYDALRSKRCYKAAMLHREAVAVMLDQSPGHFDPALLAVFREVAPELETIFDEFRE